MKPRLNVKPAAPLQWYHNPQLLLSHLNSAVLRTAEKKANTCWRSARKTAVLLIRRICMCRSALKILPPGQLPRTLAVRLVGKELVETARPGDHLSVVGIPKTTSSFNPGTGKPCRLNLQLEANSIEILGKDPERSYTPRTTENRRAFT